MEKLLKVLKRAVITLIAGFAILGIYRLLGLDTRIEIFSYNYCQNFFEIFVLLLIPITLSKVEAITNLFEFLFDIVVCAAVSIGTIFVHEKWLGILIFSGNVTFKGFLLYLVIPFIIVFVVSFFTSKLALTKS